MSRYFSIVELGLKEEALREEVTEHIRKGGEVLNGAQCFDRGCGNHRYIIELTTNQSFDIYSQDGILTSFKIDGTIVPQILKLIDDVSSFFVRIVTKILKHFQ